jgi:hypothetical protein
MVQPETETKRNSSIELLFMLILCIAAAVAICVYVLRRGPIPLRHTSPTLSTLDHMGPPKVSQFGDVLHQVTIVVEPDPADAESRKISFFTHAFPDVTSDQRDKIRDGLVQMRKDLPEKYVACFVWTEEEIILLLSPTTAPLTQPQIHAFFSVFTSMKVPLGDHGKSRKLVAQQGRYKGSHAVAMPLKKPDPPKKPPA